LDDSIIYLGEILSLLAAIFWAFAIILFKKSGEIVHPLALNFFKNILAFTLFLLTFLILNQTIIRDAPINEYLLLLLSGALGIGIGDTLFFKSLNILGAGLSAIVGCLYSPVIIFFSIIFLGEGLSVIQIMGVFLVVIAVLIASLKTESGGLSGTDIARGIFWGVLGTVSMAVGIVIIKPLLDRSPLLWATEVRLLGGILMLCVIFLIYPRRGEILSTLMVKKGWQFTFSSSFVGAYLAMIVWLGGMKYTKASIASALNQTSNLFIFIFAWLILKEPITLRRGVGIILAVLGALMVSFGSQLSLIEIFGFLV
jgi:drug/metabolite transporter (DMT)-like permease